MDSEQFDTFEQYSADPTCGYPQCSFAVLFLTAFCLKTWPLGQVELDSHMFCSPFLALSTVLVYYPVAMLLRLLCTHYGAFPYCIVDELFLLSILFLYFVLLVS